MGRPTIYSEELALAICTRIAGGETLRSICEDAGMPDKSTILTWVVDGRHNAFSDQYAKAREASGHGDADMILDVVYRAGSGELPPQTARAMLDGLKWLAERKAPKSFGQKQAIDHTSGGSELKPGLSQFYPGMTDGQ